MAYLLKLINNRTHLKFVFYKKSYLIFVIYLFMTILVSLKYNIQEILYIHFSYFFSLIVPLIILYYISRNHRYTFNELIMIRRNTDISIFEYFNDFNNIIVISISIFSMLLLLITTIIFKQIISFIYFFIILIIIIEYYSLLSKIYIILTKISKKRVVSILSIVIIISISQIMQVKNLFGYALLDYDIISYIKCILILYILNLLFKCSLQNEIKFNKYIKNIKNKINTKFIAYIIIWFVFLFTIMNFNKYLFFNQEAGCVYNYVYESYNGVSPLLLFLWFLPLIVVVYGLVLMFIDDYKNVYIHFVIRISNRKRWFLMELKKIFKFTIVFISIFMLFIFYNTPQNLELEIWIINFIIIILYSIVMFSIYILLYLLLKEKFNLNIMFTIHFLFLYFMCNFIGTHTVLFLGEISYFKLIILFIFIFIINTINKRLIINNYLE